MKKKTKSPKKLSGKIKPIHTTATVSQTKGNNHATVFNPKTPSTKTKA